MKPRIYLGDNQKVVGLYLGSNPIQIWAKDLSTKKTIAKFNSITDAQRDSLVDAISDKLGQSYKAIITLYSDESLIHSGSGPITGMTWTNLAEEAEVGQPINYSSFTGTLTGGADFTKLQLVTSNTGPLGIVELVMANKINDIIEQALVTKMSDEDIPIKNITFSSVNIAFTQL